MYNARLFSSDAQCGDQCKNIEKLQSVVVARLNIQHGTKAGQGT